ncbi:MAG: MATE family efflux transporter [Proteocatella sp.]
METKKYEKVPLVEAISKDDAKTKIKIFLNYVIPSIVAMWVFSIYTMVDGIFVANFVGPTALASVNIAMPTINLIFALSLLLSTGASTIIAINFGKGNIKEASEIFTINTAVLIIISICITVMGLLNLNALSLFLGATPSTAGMIKDYLEIILWFAIFFIVSYQFEVLVKTDGSPRLATIGVIISALTNVILDYIFIAVWGWGIQGAALATGISQVASTIIFSAYFLSKKSKLSFMKIKFEHFKIAIYRRIIALGISDSLTELSAGIIVFIFNQTILKIIGEQGIVTYTIISYANLLVLMTMIGIAQGMQPLVSYYFGKGDSKTYNYFFKLSIAMVAMCALLIMYMSFFKTENIVNAFIGQGDMELFNYSVAAFRMFSTSFIIVGFNIVISGFFVAVEKPFQAILISLSRGLFVLAISLGTMIMLMGERGIWISPCISEAVVLIISVVFYMNYKKTNSEFDQPRLQVK